MVKGSCACGNLAYEFNGEPGGWVACHCIPCRKTSGTSNSWNLMIPADKFDVKSGQTRSWTRKGDSGKDVSYFNCDNCSSLVWVEADGIPGSKLVKAGTIDDKDFMNNLGKPKGEIFCKNMTPWEDKISGADHKDSQ